MTGNGSTRWETVPRSIVSGRRAVTGSTASWRIDEGRPLDVPHGGIVRTPAKRLRGGTSACRGTFWATPFEHLAPLRPPDFLSVL
jgi:hypothetical protein